jgi:hypothetical protein
MAAAHHHGVMTRIPTALKEDDPKAAIQAFQDVVKAEPEKGDW